MALPYSTRFGPDGPPPSPGPAGVVGEAERPFLRRALQLARRGLGRTSPNPAVGAVLVRDGQVVGEGYHRRAGEPHAEAVALARAGNLALGATLYVTLEPCAHFGRTPPCADAIIRAGVRRVVACTVDPNPRVNGRGFARLREAGVEVALAGPEEQGQARELNAAYEKFITTGLPYVTLKAAMSLDGKIATPSGDSRWITSEQARALGQRLRARSDAVMVGIGTVLADDPLLTVRRRGRPAARQPLRVVVDSLARTPPTASLFTSPGPVLVAATTRAPAERVEKLRERGADVLLTPPGPDGRVNLLQLLAELGRREVVSVLVEGGGTLHAALLEADLAERMVVFIAPKILGGARAPTPVEGAGAGSVAGARGLFGWRIRRLPAGELVVDALLRPPAGSSRQEPPLPKVVSL